jgi:AcrR family transcriptional regulator
VSGTPQRGRPLDPRVTEAILRETARMLGTEGYSRTSVEAVAKAAGVGKTAVYRRFRDKAELAAAAMALLRRVDDPVATGTARGDMIAEIDRSVLAMVHGPGLGMIGTLLVEARREPELLEAFRARIISPLLERTRAAMRAGVERGEIRADADLDAAIEAMVGQIVMRFFTGLGYEEGFAERAVDVVFGGIAAGPTPVAAGRGARRAAAGPARGRRR